MHITIKMVGTMSELDSALSELNIKLHTAKKELAKARRQAFLRGLAATVLAALLIVDLVAK